VYATLCVIRGHNPWLAEHPQARQQCFLCTPPATAQGGALRIPLLQGFFSGQFQVNHRAIRWWEVYDRTTGRLLDTTWWRYDGQAVVVASPQPWHQYTVSFLAWRVWEEISMYNHVTNHWEGPHLAPLDPIHPEAQAYLKTWLAQWCQARPEVRVVRFTSLFYNFPWVWGADPRNRNLFTDWGSYDFTVSPLALKLFRKEYGYTLVAEDFVRQGRYCASHHPPSEKMLDWMDFMGSFVRRLARSLTEIVRQAGKLAYVFYDDSWIGLEPYNGHFEEMGFDGIIKCVFSGYEARLCAGVPVPTHELRFHPYLFPVGLGGAPTFSPGGDPAGDALGYWRSVRRALLRQPVERAGLGGYPHLVEGFEDFVEAMRHILEEFREIAALHQAGPPVTLPLRVGVLHAWGALRAWTVSGHFHEVADCCLVHLLEALSGLPVAVRFLNFNDLRQGALSTVDLLINGGRAGDAWSGGDAWLDPEVCDTLTAWVHGGGVFLGVEEPSAVTGQTPCFRMAHVLGVDAAQGWACHGRWQYDLAPLPELWMGAPPETVLGSRGPGVRLTDGQARVAAEYAGDPGPAFTLKDFGKGKGIYLGGFRTGPAADRFLLNLLLYALGLEPPEGVPDCPEVECALFPAAGRLVWINRGPVPRQAGVVWRGRRYAALVEAWGMKTVGLEEGTVQRMDGQVSP
jgi:beta-D-galactosyl-(1->4)-L-rhamnose phosphorylase